MFIGGILTATSVGITARVLRDIGKDTTEEARVILGAAVIDDVLCLIILAVVSGLAVTGKISVASIAITTGKATLFLVASLGIGIWLMPKLVRRLGHVGVKNLQAALRRQLRVSPGLARQSLLTLPPSSALSRPGWC